MTATPRGDNTMTGTHLARLGNRLHPDPAACVEPPTRAFPRVPCCSTTEIHGPGNRSLCGIIRLTSLRMTRYCHAAYRKTLEYHHDIHQ